ncbi:MAG: type IX secretion system outer membrane channel protein PorV, partial [Cytophagaceae bacterium]
MAAKRLGVLFFIAAILFSLSSHSQSSTQKLNLAGFNRGIVTSVPFLIMAPDARAGSMGDVGAATSPDANASHWNSAKLAFIGDDEEDEEKHKRYGFATSYNPWLRKLVGDMSLNYLTGYTKIRKEEALAFNLLYFDLGKIQFTDANNNSLGEGHPNEFSVGGNYSRKLSQKLGVGVGLKYIHSNLANGQQINGTVIKAGNTAAGDIGIFYRTDAIMRRTGKVLNLAFGANISDIGPKISYSNQGNTNFIPTNLRLGSAVTVPLDQFNKITFALDVNKLLVPSPPQYLQNSHQGDSIDASGN